MNQSLKKPFPGIKQTTGYLVLGIVMTLILMIMLGAIHGGIYAGIQATKNPEIATEIITKQAVESFTAHTGEYTFVAVVLTNLLLTFLGLKWSKTKYKELFTRETLIDKKIYLWSIVTTLGIGMMFNLVNNLLINNLAFMKKSYETLQGAFTGGILITLLLVIVNAPFFEEIIFRGIILDGLSKRHSYKKSIIMSALFFGLYHLNMIQFGSAFVLGLFFAYVYLNTKSLKLCMLLHFVNNGFAMIVSYITKDSLVIGISHFVLFTIGIIFASYGMKKIKENLRKTEIN